MAAARIKSLKWLSLLLLSGAAPYETMVSLPSIAALQADNFGSRQRIYISSYGTNVPGGGGTLLLTPGGVVDGVICFADKASNVFCREPSAVNATLDANDGGIITDGVHNNSLASIQNVLNVAATNKIDTVKFCGSTLVDPTASGIINVPAGTRVDLCDSATALRPSLNYTTTGGLTGILGIPATVSVQLNSNSGIQHGTLERYDNNFSPALFTPVTLRDALNVQNAELTGGTGIVIPAGTRTTQITDLAILGFNIGIDSHEKSPNWNHVNVDAVNAYSINGATAGAHLIDLESAAYLTHNTPESWIIDWIGDNGAGKYQVVGEVTPSDILWHDGDIAYIGTNLGGGAQSAAGQHTFDCGGGDCAVVPNGTNHCVSPAGCEVATLPDTNSGTNPFVASWTAGIGTDRHPNPLIIQSGNLANLSVGQVLTSAFNCSGPTPALPANTRIKDIITYDGVTWVYPTIATVCSGTAQTVDATDDVFTTSKRGIEISPVQRRGVGFNCTNSGGITVTDLHLYTFDLAVHIGDHCRQVRLNAPSFGENDALDEGELTTMVIDGLHQGNDGGDVFVDNCVLGQHTGFALHIASDSPSQDRFTNCSIGPAVGKKTGTMVELEAGNLQLVNVGAHVPGNAIFHDGTTYSNVFIDNKNDGEHYAVNDVLTVASGHGTTCSTYPQYTVTQVQLDDGEILDGFQSRAGIGCSFASGSFPTTGGSGDGTAELMIDGFIPATVQAANVLTPNGDWYEQTPYGVAFNGVNNICLTGVCNSAQSGIVQGNNTLFTGPAPSVSAGGGTGVSVSGNDTVGRISLGSFPTADAITLTFYSSKLNPPVCQFVDETTPTNNPIYSTSASTTAVTATTNGVFQSSDKISYSCLQFK